MVEACKNFVDVIWNVNINSFLIIIPFHINYTEYFTLPIDSDTIAIFNVLIRWSALCFPNILVPKLSTTRLKVVGCVK